ncbi:MAG: hypothetical protein ABI867_34470 [Kofleriaceae bacterium]
MRWIAIAGLVVAACSKSDPGPSCEQVVDHMLEVTKSQLVGHGDGVQSQRAAMVKQCKDRDMPAATRKCLVAATTLTQIAECRAGTTEGKLPEKPAPRSPVVKPGSGSPP